MIKSLEEFILSDYGTSALKIGSFLLHKNLSTFKEILEKTNLNEIAVRDGLSFLIQKRFVNFFSFEKKYKYFLDKNMLIRRLYYPLYYNYCINNFNKQSAKYFLKVLLCGTLKENANDEENNSKELLDKGILIYLSKNNTKNTVPSTKQFKSGNKFIVVNYDLLDQRLLEDEITKIIKKRYNEACSSIYKSVLNCVTVNEENILKNLNTTKILITDKNLLINEKNNINEYLKYLVGSKFLIKSLDNNKMYFPNISKDMVKNYKINIFLKDSGMRRIYNMINSRIGIEDKDVTIFSLLSVVRVKSSLFNLQRLGLISQQCIGEYSGGGKMEHKWFVDKEFASKSMILILQEEIKKRLQELEKQWNLNYLNIGENEHFNLLLSEIINLSMDLCLFNIK